MMYFDLKYFVIDYKQNPIWTLMYLIYSNLVGYVVVTGCDKEVIKWVKEHCEYEVNRRCRTKNGCKRWYMETLAIPFEDEDIYFSCHKDLFNTIGEKEYRKLAENINQYIKDKTTRHTKSEEENQ